MRKLGIKFPAVLDGFENATEKAYTGWPERIYLIDQHNRVLYKSKPGPFGFKPPELEQALRQLQSQAAEPGLSLVRLCYSLALNFATIAVMSSCCS